LTRGLCASWQQSHSVSVPAPASQPRRRFQSPDVTSGSSWTSAQAALSPLGRTEPCHGRRAASRNRAECASHAISQGTQRTWSHRGEQARGSSKSVWRKRRRRAAVGARPRNRMLEPRLRWAFRACVHLRCLGARRGRSIRRRAHLRGSVVQRIDRVLQRPGGAPSERACGGHLRSEGMEKSTSG
jgi:hypothetical protein